MKWSNGDSPGPADGSNRPRSLRDAIAIPTAEDNPWPNGPVVISTPLVWWYSGCPGVSDPHVRNASRSASSRPNPARYSWMYRVNEECPADSTNRSRPTQVGSAGSCRITFWNRLYANGARLIAVPGWPLPTFCTASAANTRAVSTDLMSRADQNSGCEALVSLLISVDSTSAVIGVSLFEAFLNTGEISARGKPTTMAAREHFSSLRKGGVVNRRGRGSEGNTGVIAAAGIAVINGRGQANLPGFRFWFGHSVQQ